MSEDKLVAPRRELFLPDLELNMVIALEAVPPDGLYLPGTVSEIVARCVMMHMFAPHGESTVRLHANAAGQFVTDEDRPVRVFLGKNT